MKNTALFNPDAESAALLNAEMPVREVPPALDAKILAAARFALAARAEKKKKRDFALWITSIAAVAVFGFTSIFGIGQKTVPLAEAVTAIPSAAAENALFETRMAELTLELEKSDMNISSVGDEIYMAQLNNGFGYFVD